MLLKEDIKTYLKMESEFNELRKKIRVRIAKVLKMKEQLETGKSYIGSIINLKIINNIVYVETEDLHDNDDCTYNYEFPEEYLYHDNWIEQIKTKLIEKKKIEILKEEEKEKMKYLELKEKYPNL